MRLSFRFLILLIMLLLAGCFQDSASLTSISYSGPTGTFIPVGIGLATSTSTPTATEPMESTTLPLLMTDTPGVKTDTLAPLITATPTLIIIDPTRPVVSNTPASATLRLFATRDSLTLVVDEAVNLNGLQFQTVGASTITVMTLFDGLQLTGGDTQVGDCYVLVRDGAAPPLAGACAVPARIFKRNVTPSDVFWFDILRVQMRDIAIYQDGSFTGQICSGALSECDIRYGS
ncbi:MAG: hypothetical protein H6672_17410 [Anaerolineaceae bacterium]|nr:hypothetical protein [Anaerolineaceae bacterium]